ncbi:MAG TPA: phospho-N-acetylmuramoyl-pentapeptide-transferase [Candidatus Methylacidiphilales bacterium]|nr:phospho-N-acetylmuramoyl-pentapeptide-transferase [Candidatus Methylacidiphilales bacterium]
MLYYLHYLSSHWSPLNVFRYETFRAMAAALTSLAFSFVLGPRAILLLTRLKLGQPLRQKSEVRELADLHSGKKGTPTMGGILILLATTISSLLWCDPATRLYWLALGSMLYLGMIGFVDDYTKVVQKNSRGIRAWQKLVAQALLAVFVYFYLSWTADYPGAYNSLYIPFLKTPVVVDMVSFLAILFFGLVIMGTSNAVNLTDGLDGLAIGCFVCVAMTYAVFCYVTGNARLATYLYLRPVSGADELAVFCAALVGSGLGFLWFNCHPARVFMGDTGSLALGGVLGVIAICVHQELALVIAGGVFVLEAVSVLLQVASFKLTGKRIFAMSPLHHHFELKGWEESTVTVRFWILSLVASLLALATLKLR